MKIFGRWLALTSVVAAMALPAHAVTKTIAPESGISELAGDARAKAVVQIEAYLSDIPSVVSKFTQDSADGSTGKGKFYLKRPGKMRWEYEPPAPALLISDGKTVTYYDIAADQVSYIALDDTLAGFLVNKQVKLDNETFALSHVEQGNGLLRFTVVQKKKPAEGSLTLEFKESPMELVRIVSVDATGNETRVKLENPQFGPVVDDKLFVFNDPRSVNAKRNRRR